MEFVRVTIKLPQDLHDYYLELAKDTGVAKSSLMVMDLKRARDTAEVMEGMKTNKK